MVQASTRFTASPVSLTSLLDEAEQGRLQLPDFQRNWVWDEERIRGLISSISRGFPVGAIMTLETGGETNFKPRPLEGTPAEAGARQPSSLLLDGQQRLTSLYQVLKRQHVVETMTPRRQKVKRWFYLDMRRCLDETEDRDDAVRIIPESKQITSDLGRQIDLDLSTREREFEEMMVPLSAVLNWVEWQNELLMYFSKHDPERMTERLSLANQFHEKIVKNFTGYLVPVIRLEADTSKEAVCVVFEKVNTGGKPLDAFELITAMYAAEGYELRKDWYGDGKAPGRHERLRGALRMPSASEGVLAGVGNTDFMQAISLFHSRELREQARAAGKTGKELPRISANRASLLSLPLVAYLKYQDRVEEGFISAAKFLIRLGIYRVKDLPYQSQIVPLAAILADLGNEAESAGAVAKLEQWYWNGVFGELYGSSTESRSANDFVEVPAWIRGSAVLPRTIDDATFRADRLRSMRMRVSAAYKGVNALLMHHGARDFRTGQQFSNTVFFDENVDIHHIFPQAWCKANGLEPAVYDSIINKTPLSARTNRMIGGDAPSAYLQRVLREGETSTQELDSYLATHLIDADALRNDDFETFMRKRQTQLVTIIQRAIGKSVIIDEAIEPEEFDDDVAELAFEEVTHASVTG